MNGATAPLIVFTVLVLAAMVIPVLRTRPRPIVQGPIDDLDAPIAAHAIAEDCAPGHDSDASARRDAQEQQWAAEREAANAEWRARWPNHCSACSGWGGSHHTESHGFRHGAGEQIFDLCEAVPETQCHRCGEQGLSPEGEGPCTRCAWNFDDGLQLQ
jgi:hypothetical protein